jgi:transcriptional regulator with XRE-family HTH domain
MAFDAFLCHEFDRRRARNARYSMRSFARDLGCDHATLSQWLRGKRPMTSDGVAKLSKALKLDRASRARAEAFEPFDIGVIEAVRGLASPTTTKVAMRLGTDADRVNIALHRLLRLGLLRMDGMHWRET